MCFDYREFVAFHNDLKHFFESTFFVKRFYFDVFFRSYLQDRFELDPYILDVIVRSVNKFSSDQKLNCCINFTIRLIMLAVSVKCAYCTKKSDHYRDQIYSTNIQKECDRKLDSTLKNDFNVIRQTENNPFINQLGIFDKSTNHPNSRLNTILNSSELFDDCSSNLNKVIQVKEQDYSSIMFRCSSSSCLPCSSTFNYSHSLIVNSNPPSSFLVIDNLRFQDLQFNGLFVENLDQNMISKDFYDLLDHLRWPFTVAEVKMKDRFNNQIVNRKLLCTRLPITLPNSIELYKRTRSTVDDNWSTNTKATYLASMNGSTRSMLNVKFYYDPKYFIGSNLFGRSLLNKLQITIDKKRKTFTFENNPTEFKLKEQLNTNNEDFGFLRFVD